MQHNPATGMELSRHKRVRWRIPTGKKRPDVLQATAHQLVRCLEHRSGIAWFRICRDVLVAGYAISRAGERVRALRSDGAESLLAMSVALLYLSDIRTGYVGKPPLGGAGKWHRYSLADLAQLAFGAQAEADIRRARRAIDMMIGLGWAFPTKQVRRHSVDAQGADLYRSEPAVRRLNLTKLCGIMGTQFLLARDRANADRIKGAVNLASLSEARAKKASTGAGADDRRRAADVRAAAAAAAAVLDLLGN